MRPFFADRAAMDATAYVNIMAYNDYTDDMFRGDLKKVKDLLNDYTQAIQASGLTEQEARKKLILGYQVYESNRVSSLSTPLDACKLGRLIKNENYGGIFFFGLGSGPGNVPDLTPAQERQYIENIQKGLTKSEACN